MPRSKRYDESLCRPSLRAVLRTDRGTNSAVSIRTFVVGIADFGVEAPHHAGDRRRGDWASAITHISAVNSYCRWSMAVIFSPGCGPADDDLAAVELVEIEGVQRLAAFHEDVVGDIDDVVDRPNAQRFAGGAASIRGWARS